MTSPPYGLRPAHPDDIAACVDLRGRTRENAISRAELARRGVTEAGWREDLRSGLLPGFVACEGEAIVGYCFANRDTGEVVVLAILPAHEGRGLGRALLSRMVAHMCGLGHRRLHLEAAADPRLRAHGFYRHLGWRPVGRQTERGDEELEFLARDRG
jgi:ribosomal protein S18 acetylase RimI-like enzyme